MPSEYDRNDPKWRFEERVQSLMRKHQRTREEAEEMVMWVIKHRELCLPEEEEE